MVDVGLSVMERSGRASEGAVKGGGGGTGDEDGSGRGTRRINILSYVDTVDGCSLDVQSVLSVEYLFRGEETRKRKRKIGPNVVLYHTCVS